MLAVCQNSPSPNASAVNQYMLTILGYLTVAIIFGLVFAFVIPSVVRMSRRSNAVQKHAREIMRDRRSMSASEFGSEYFSTDQAEIASRLRDILKKVLIVDATRIHPEDRLIEDLGLGQVDGLDPNFLELDIEHSFGVSLRPTWSSIKTVRDLVTYVSTNIPP